MVLPPGGRFISNPLVSTFKETIDQLISDMGRDITLILTPHEVDCPNCQWDPLHHRSRNIYTANASGANFDKSFPEGHKCPVCKGRGRLTFPRQGTIKVLINKGPKPSEFDYEAYGFKQEDTVQTKSQLVEIDAMNSSSHAIIDGVKYERVTWSRKTGLRDLAFIRTLWKRISA